MKRGKVYYVSYYDILDGEREYALSCTNKMNYIIQILKKLNYEIEIISASYGLKRTFVKGSYTKIADDVYLKTFSCPGHNNAFKRILQRKVIAYQLKKYLQKTLDGHSIVIVYHSLGYYKLYRTIKKMTNNFILEVEEIYTDVSKTKLASKKRELSSLSNACAYIFPTQIMNDKFNLEGKRSVIIHGIYTNNMYNHQRDNNDKIDIVYAGTFDLHKGGAITAIRASYFLNQNYCLHIIGFGNQHDTAVIKREIENAKLHTKCNVIYEGLKKGKEFNEFLAKCQIGLSTQNIDGNFNDTSFPSKILTYLSNGLKVVSARLPVVECSGVSSCVTFYESQEPKDVAKAIMSVELTDSDDIISKTLQSLEDDFLNDIKSLIEN